MRVRGHRQRAVAPPSATSIAAVKKLDSSERRKHAAAAISSGSPSRAWIECGTAGRPSSAAASRASCREKEMIPPFAAAYAPRLGRASSAAVEATFTIEPPPAARRRGNVARQTRNVPVRWTASILFQSASESSSIGTNCAKPAALKTQSMRPSSRSADRTASLTESSSATSQASPTEPSSSDATASARSRSRSTTATRPSSAAKRRAVAAARPEPPPVANSTLPAKRGSSVLVALLVLERNIEAHTVARDLPVLDRHVETRRLRDAKIADRLSRRVDGVLRGRLPRIRAGADHLRYAIDALSHGLAPLGSVCGLGRRMTGAAAAVPAKDRAGSRAESTGRRGARLLRRCLRALLLPHVAAVDGEQRLLLGRRQQRIGPDRRLGGSRGGFVLEQPGLREHGVGRELERLGDRAQDTNRRFVEPALDLTQVGVRDIRHRRKLAKREVRELALRSDELPERFELVLPGIRHL